LVNASDLASVEVSGNCAGVKFSGDCAGIKFSGNCASVSSQARVEACKRRSCKQEHPPEACGEHGFKGRAGGAVKREALGEMRGKGNIGKLAIKSHLCLLLWEKLKKIIRRMLGNGGSRYKAHGHIKITTWEREMNTQLPVEPLASGENYSLLIMGVNNVDGDGSGGNSPSRQGARTETSVPQNWSSMAAALRNFSWKDADSFRVFTMEGIYRRKGDVRGRLRGPHHGLAWLGVDPRHQVVWPPRCPPPSLLWTPPLCREK
jgi:hypothetical protein